MPLDNGKFREKLQLWRMEAMALSEELRTLEEAHREQQSQLKAELKRAYAHLAALYIPSFTREALSYAAKATGLSALATERPFLEQREDARASRERLNAISLDERFQRSQALLMPEVGPLAVRLTEANAFLAPWVSTYETYQKNNTFIRLQRSGYNTPAYVYKWWHPLYYRDWREGDELVEAFGKKDWNALATEYLQAKRETERWTAVKEQIEAEMNQIVGLVEEHRALTIRLNSLDDVHCELWRQALIDHVRGLAPTVLHQLTESEQIRGQLALVSGLNAKSGYLEALKERRIETDRAAVDKALAKANLTLNKTFRTKNAHRRWADHEVAAATPALRARLAPKWEKHQSTVRTLLEFSTYTAVNLATDVLWWDIMTDGKLDGDFIPEVQQFRLAHPNASRTGLDEDEDDSALGSAIRSGHGSLNDDATWDAS